MTSQRVPWPERIMQLAAWWAQWSTCRWMQTGAVVVDGDYQVLVSGFNGPARGQPHCTEVEQPRESHRDTCLHAEMNCIVQAARTGISLDGRTMFSLHRPCIRCAPYLVQVGISTLHWRLEYATDGRAAEALGILESAGIAVVRLPLGSPLAR